MAKIVDTDNFGGDYPNEKFVLWEMRRDQAQRIADVLNEGGENASRFYKVVENDYVLQTSLGARALLPGFEP